MSKSGVINMGRYNAYSSMWDLSSNDVVAVEPLDIDISKKYMSNNLTSTNK